MSKRPEFKPQPFEDDSEIESRVARFAAQQGIPDSAARPRPVEIAAEAPPPKPRNPDIPKPRKPEIPVSRDVPLGVDVPEYVLKQIKRKAFDQEVSARYFMLTVLKGAGLDVREEDLIPDRRKDRGRAR